MRNSIESAITLLGLSRHRHVQSGVRREPVLFGPHQRGCMTGAIEEGMPFYSQAIKSRGLGCRGTSLLLVRPHDDPVQLRLIKVPI